MKRGTSGLSLVVGVDKAAGLSSHDVVDRARRIFGERRVGHAGTLDPMATGVLPLCIGPATRLGPYLTGHDKRYRARIAFGVGTDTDDAEGRQTSCGEAPACVADVDFAAGFVASLEGPHRQTPPSYSAVKVQGRKSYEAARAGDSLKLEPRDVMVYEARLVGVQEARGEASACWDVDFHVSKGTYIRALARDMGAALGCPAHLSRLERSAVGPLDVSECLSLEELEKLKEEAALDPLRLLGLRFAHVGGAERRMLANGGPLAPASLVLQECPRSYAGAGGRSAGGPKSRPSPHEGETVALIADGKLAALYAFDKKRALYHARCVFQTGVSRGRDI